MGVLQTVLTILGVGQAAMPLIEKLFGGFMLYTATLAKQLFGDGAAQKIDDIKAEADGVVANFETDATGAIKLVTESLPVAEELLAAAKPVLDALWAAHPGLPQQLASELVVRQGQNIPRSLAVGVVKASHSDLKVAAAPAKA